MFSLLHVTWLELDPPQGQDSALDPRSPGSKPEYKTDLRMPVFEPDPYLPFIKKNPVPDPDKTQWIRIRILDQ